MPPSNEALYEKALELFAKVPDKFLDLGRALRQLLDHDPELFQKFVAKTGIGRRKAYYLVEISRTFEPLQVPRARLHDLGWTKVQLIGKHVTQDNVDELLKLAESSSANELERVLSGKKPLGNARCVLMYFSPKQYDELEDALLRHGGERSGRGVENKEEAMIKMVRRLRKFEQDHPIKK
jgi:hypothetical protein